MASTIGTLNEGPLHASIKELFASATGVAEAPVRSYTVDVLDGERIVEIQTASFSSIRRKLNDLVKTHRVRLVHPIARDKWILKETGAGAVVRRKSPKRGGFADIFVELVSIPALLLHPRFELEVILTREEELRRFDGRKGRRRRGWVVVERRLCEVVDRRLFRRPDDLWGLLSSELPSSFNTADLASALQRPRWVGQKAAYCLKACGQVQPVGAGPRRRSLPADVRLRSPPSRDRSPRETADPHAV